jgi:surface antigen
MTAATTGITMKKIIALSLFLISLPCFAINLGFLKNSLLSQINEPDFVLLKRDIGKALNTSADKHISHWTSSNAIAVQIMPKLSYNHNGNACRKTLFKLSQENRKPEFYRFEICKDNSGVWGIAQTLVQQLVQQDWDLLQSTLTEALDEPALGVPVSWFNPHTGVAGVIVVLAPSKQTLKNCSDVAVSVIDNQGAALDGNYTFCKQVDGWQRKM